MTVLIPLHRSARFLDVVEANLARLAGGVRIVVSDADAADDTLARLRAAWSGEPTIDWRGPRPIAPGWVSHYNDLLLAVGTRYAMWLPHDDEIDLHYVVACRAALIGDPTLVAAVGVIDPVAGPGLRTPIPPAFPAAAVVERYRAAANAYLVHWDPGILARAVLDTTRVRPLPSTTTRDEWADEVWAYGVCLDGPVVSVPDAVYRKRFLTRSTHTGWRGGWRLRAQPYLWREVLTRPALRGRPLVVAEMLRVLAWAAVRRKNAWRPAPTVRSQGRPHEA